MSQATLSGGYHNSNLFSKYYLDERVYDLDAWDCDEEAREVFEELSPAQSGTCSQYSGTLQPIRPTRLIRTPWNHSPSSIDG